jgi:hypothetical protein
VQRFTFRGAGLVQLLLGGSSQSINDTRVNAALASLSTAGAVAFNAMYPQGAPGTPSTVNGIAYYSASGNKVNTNG